MLIRKLTIRTRFALGFAIILLLLATVSAISIRNISVATKATENIYNHPFVVSNTVRDIKANVIAIHRSMKDVALAKDEQEMNEARFIVDEYEKRVYKDFEIVLAKFLGEKRDVQNAYNSFSKWKIIREEVISLWTKGNKKEAIEITKGKGATHVEKVLSDIDVMIDFARFKADEFHNITDTNAKQTYDFMIALILVSFILFLITIIVLSKSILNPISALNHTATKIESGDLSARNVISSGDELGLLALSFNRMIDSINSRTQVLANLEKISTTLHGMSEKRDFSQSILALFMELTKAKFAVFYILDSESETFIPFDAIGADKQNLPVFSALNPPGDIGNVIHNKDVHILRNIDESNYFKYESVIGNLLMREVITTPILDSEEVVAFVSCGVLDSFSNDSIEVFKQSVPIISTSFTTLLASQKTKEYSERLAKTNEELELQSEELQAQTEELKQQAEEIKASSENLYEQNIELEIQRKEVEEATRLKSEFLSNMSHELRTPLNSINALSKVLIMQASEKLNTDEGNYLQIIERNGKRLLSLINDILDLSKIEAGKVELTPSNFMAKDFLFLSVENIRALADEKGVKINIHVDDTIEINSDEGRLYQIITNVIGNAIKFTSEGEINISCEEAANKITLKVQDTGIGISKEQLPFIFKEFRQADGSTSRSYEGTGLGLAIAKKIIHQLKGEITCESEVGVGSVFKIVIPKTWDTEIIVEEPQYTSERESENTDETERTAEQQTILVVDDDHEFVTQLSENLKTNGFNVIHSTSGKDAIEMAIKHKPLAITLDIVMPEMDGWEVLLRLKKNNTTAHIPVIIISNSEEADTSLALGAVGYIQKPVEKDILLQEIENINNAANHILIADDNEIDIIHLKNSLINENYSISSCNSGRECLQMLRTQTPDVLLLDLMMPEIDGFEVLKEISQNEQWLDLPVIILTAKDLSIEERKLLSKRAAAVVTKDANSAYNIIHEIRRIILGVDKKINAPHNSKEKPSILIIEDNESAIIQVKKVLEQAGLNVNHAFNGIGGLDFMEKSIPDGIILDLMMPDMDGFEVLERIRSHKTFRNIPIIVLTAKNLSDNEYRRITQHDVRHLMQKGDIDVEQLTNRVKRMIKVNRILEMPEESFTSHLVPTKSDSINLPKEIKKIVLIEDNPDNRVTIKAILGNEFTIIEAEDGETGLKLLNKELPDLVLLDISLPVMDGYGVIEKIRQKESIASIPVIAVTAKAMVNDKERILQAGCNDYVSKPIDDEELKATIRKYI